MIARTLCFTSVGKLSLAYEQLAWDGEDGTHRTVPIEDIGFVIIESERVVVSSALLRNLAERNVAVMLCDASHMPAAQLLPYASHTTAAEHVDLQLAASEAVEGRIWRQICRAKIRNQAELMQRLGIDAASRLRGLVGEVKNGDPANCEAQAARIYFQSLGPEGFTRERYGVWPNPPLNYGYAILRAAVARAIIGSGLTCFRGIHHHNRYNAFALADDLMEPYRPFVDQYVFGGEKPFDGVACELTREMRAKLLEVLTCDVRLGENRRPLMVALSYTTASVVRYLKKETDELSLPSFV